MTVVLVLSAWAALALFGGLVMSAIGRVASNADDVARDPRRAPPPLTPQGDAPRSAGPTAELLS